MGEQHTRQTPFYEPRKTMYLMVLALFLFESEIVMFKFGLAWLKEGLARFECALGEGSGEANT